MTKKDFSIIAGVLEQAKPDAITFDARIEKLRLLQWENLCLNMASALQNYNPLFDAHRFLSACGMDLNAQ